MAEIELEHIGDISLDMSKFPKSTLLIKRSDGSLIKRADFSTHAKGMKVLMELNGAWHAYLKETHEQEQIACKTPKT